jgi:muramoyltetrapeptide carboxypeptidase
VRIGVVASGTRIDESLAERTIALARTTLGAQAPDLFFHPQCFLSQGHFAGSDEARAAAFLEIANDPAYDALWFARGGYGANRLLDRVLPGLGADAKRKTYLGYSDAGFLLAGLYGRGFTGCAHGPIPVDLVRDGGEAAVARALRWLCVRDAAALEPSVAPGTKAAAFNITVLSAMIGTPYEPDLSGHVLMLEEVGEYMYRIDRALFHITSSANIRRVAGIRLGRCSDIPANDKEFGLSDEDVMRHWCAKAGIAWLGRADIGHDSANRIVPFGRA